MRRGATNGAASISTYGETADSCSNCRRTSAGRAARRFARRVGVEGWAKDEITGVALDCEFGNVSLAEKHQAGCAKQRDRRLVAIRDKVDEQKAAPSRGETFQVEVIFDAHG